MTPEPPRDSDRTARGLSGTMRASEMTAETPRPCSTTAPPSATSAPRPRPPSALEPRASSGRPAHPTPFLVNPETGCVPDAVSATDRADPDDTRTPAAPLPVATAFSRPIQPASAVRPAPAPIPAPAADARGPSRGRRPARRGAPIQRGGPRRFRRRPRHPVGVRRPRRPVGVRRPRRPVGDARSRPGPGLPGLRPRPRPRPRRRRRRTGTRASMGPLGIAHADAAFATSFAPRSPRLPRRRAFATIFHLARSRRGAGSRGSGHVVG